MDIINIGFLQEWLEIIVYIFLIIQLVIMGIAWRNLSKRASWNTHTNTWASILTVIGIFGTFFGIYIGLQAFEIEDIDGSIPELLEGLKFAFLTSLVGIFSAIILKWNGVHQTQKSSDTNEEIIRKLGIEIRTALEPIVTSGKSNLSSQFDDLADTIKGENIETRKVLESIKTELIGEQKDQGVQTRETLTDMQAALIGKHADTLTQLETLTTTVSEKHDALLNGVEDALTPIQTSLIDVQTGVLTKFEELATTVSEKQNELLNGILPLLTAIQNSLIDTEIGVLTKLETLTTTVSDKHDALLNGTVPALTTIQDSLIDTETGVLRKLETLAATVSDEHDKLRTEFETFSNNVAESITKLATNELIEALSKVIEEFNAKITEQFGDNFKQLNEAVGKTVEWQQQYREEMNELTDAFLLALEGIEKSEDALQNVANSSSAIVERSNSIVSCAEKLEPIIHTMNDQLEVFSTLRQNAIEAFPFIEERLKELTTRFSSTVQEAITNSQTSMDTQREAFQGQSDQLQNIVNGLDGFTEKIEGLTQNVSVTVENLSTSLDIQKRATDDLMRVFVSMHSILQTTLEQELPESINAVARKLAALSEKFVEDYTKITDGFREVLMVVERTQPKMPGI